MDTEIKIAIGVIVVVLLAIFAWYSYTYGVPFMTQVGSDPRMKQGPCRRGQWQYGENTTGPWCCTGEPTSWSDATKQFEHCPPGSTYCYMGKGPLPAGEKAC